MATQVKTTQRATRIQGILFTALTLTLISTWAVAERPAEPRGITLTEQQGIRLVKQDYRAFRLAQEQAAHVVVSEAEEMRQVKADYRNFRRAQRQASSVHLTEQQEMHWTKADHRQFRMAQAQVIRLAMLNS